MRTRLDIAILGLSISSSWGNGHATTYRGLVRELARRGHRIAFYERDVPWYRENRDLPRASTHDLHLYGSVDELIDRHLPAIRSADLVIVGSYVPEGIRVIDEISRARGILAFYDIDTPVTLEKLAAGNCDYLAPRQIARFDLYLSFTGGPALQKLEREYGARAARPLYCSVDPEIYFPEPTEVRWDLGYLGTYSEDRQPALERLLLEPARSWPDGRFVVAGPMYPADLAWPPNVAREIHVNPREHRRFYAAQRFTLNVTREAMVRVGHSPSVRLFEAAACGVPIISDLWDGIEELFEPGREILLCRTPREVLDAIRDASERMRVDLAARARARVLGAHTAAHRAEQLERYFAEAFFLGRLRPAAPGRRAHPAAAPEPPRARAQS